MDAYRERGKLKFELGDKQGAEEEMQKLLEMNPDEMANVSGDYTAEGVEQAVKRAYSNMNPFGIWNFLPNYLRNSENCYKFATENNKQ